MEFQNLNENEFHGFGNLIIWLWKSFGNFFKVLLRTLLTVVQILDLSICNVRDIRHSKI